MKDNIMHIYLSAATLTGLTCEVNNSDHLVTTMFCWPCLGLGSEQPRSGNWVARWSLHGSDLASALAMDADQTDICGIDLEFLSHTVFVVCQDTLSSRSAVAIKRCTWSATLFGWWCVSGPSVSQQDILTRSSMLFTPPVHRFSAVADGCANKM